MPELLEAIELFLNANQEVRDRAVQILKSSEQSDEQKNQPAQKDQ